MKDKFTPNYIESLEDNEVFVFGSNLDGFHLGGAARIAKEYFGAVWGQGVGLQGKSYAIPTMQGGVETITPPDFVTQKCPFCNWLINNILYLCIPLFWGTQKVF